MKTIVAQLFLLLVCGVAEGETQFSDRVVRNDHVDRAESYQPKKFPTKFEFRGPLLRVESYGVTCVLIGDELDLVIENVDTDVPIVPTRDPVMLCDEPDVWTNGMSIECEQHVVTDWLNWWDRFYVFVNEDVIDGTYVGFFDWVVDGGEYFWCVHEFQITDAEVEYVYR